MSRNFISTYLGFINKLGHFISSYWLFYFKEYLTRFMGSAELQTEDKKKR
jgi:hypothetical protein